MQMGQEPLVLESLSVDALGNSTKSRSNGLGHTVQSVDQAGNMSIVQYDAGGNAINKSSAMKSSAMHWTMHWTNEICEE